MSGTNSVTVPHVEGLHATTAIPLPFAPTSVVRAFLLERERGNLLVYSTPGLEGDVASLRARGPVTRQYLTHSHEAALGLAPSLGAPLAFHEADAREIRAHGGEGETFAARHRIDDDFEAIPIPGHTPGSTAYLWTSGDNRLLFTGDSLYLHRGKWRVALLESSDRTRYIESLELIRELDFNVLVPWVVDGDDPYMVTVTAAERHANIDTLLTWLRRADARG